EAHVPGHDRADLLHERSKRTFLSGDERRIGRAAVDESHEDALAKLVDVGRVQKDLHKFASSRAEGRRGQARSTRTAVPPPTDGKAVASPAIPRNRFTGLAGRISSSWLAGVGPKKMQNADPGGQ